tara:strand:+ start:108 stop:392 length:285 start_codon:yes stop_codon:yes gene_type:complete
MSKQQNNSYSAEFKVLSIKLALESNQPIVQTARDLGIKVNTLHTWVNNQLNSKELNNMTKNSEYYNWLNRPISNRDKENRKLTQMIKEIFMVLA